ncbi:hypothetical protein GmHk_12G035256 [Glycine max]|nr:hypothetical protein GmHk_12G035256 [Glycine max]
MSSNPSSNSTDTTISSDAWAESTDTNVGSDSSSVTSKATFTATPQKNNLLFRYDGTTFYIRLRQHRQKVYFADGLKLFRKDLQIFESVTIKFLACENTSTFDLYFIPSLQHQSCARPFLFSREHIWTIEITQSMLAALEPLRLPNCAMTHVNACGKHMTILRRIGPPLQWNAVVLHIGMSQRYVVQPWYQFLMDSDFSHGDEVSFYYMTKDKIWEIVIRRNKNWDY